MTQRCRFDRYEDMRQAPAGPCPVAVPVPAVAPTAPAGGMALAAGRLEGTPR
ncbi:hypothetical protein OG698_24840 [Streptomyces sp. NBC_01003]|uniref:hypothetical protein n=1 Tax=Streptomyces sp. NBC_01003 TaxID=2903714 RepID=UPI00386B37F3|nr:hypothetical protein OG698_24840 [Streptomyces sp. NBC_01003]